MKLKASVIYIALVCGSLLLSLSWACARRTPESTSTEMSKLTSGQPEAASAQPPGPTPTANLQGSYTLIDFAAATDKVTKAIEYSVKGMHGEGKARKKLRETNLPPPRQITIWYSAADFSIKTDQSGLIQTPPDGTSKPWKEYAVSTKWVNENLQRTFKSSDGQRIDTFRLSADGKTLTMQVIGTSAGWRHLRPSLQHPLTYELDYKRD